MPTTEQLIEEALKEFDELKLCRCDNGSLCMNTEYIIKAFLLDKLTTIATKSAESERELAEKINNLDYQLAKDHDKLHRFGQFSERLVRRSDVLNLLNNS